MESPTLDKFPKGILSGIDIQRAFIASRLIIAAERLQVFRFLGEKRRTADEVRAALHIHADHLGPFLNALAALGLLSRRGRTYGNSPFADEYFVKQRSIYWTRQYSAECVEDYDALAGLEHTLASGKRSRPKGLGYVERMQRDRRRAGDFTQMLFHLHQEDAEALAGYLNLARYRAVLDVAGGSGVMSIALARRYPHLKATILDIAPVCAVAAGNVRRAGLSDRVTTVAGDIRRALPKCHDVVLLCDIGAISAAMLSRAWRSLPSGGLLVLADRYLSADGLRPVDRLLDHFVGSSFGLATWRDMVAAVRSCRFRRVRARNVYRDVWFVTGTK